MFSSRFICVIWIHFALQAAKNLQLFFIVRVRVKIKENGNYLTVAMLNNFRYRFYSEKWKKNASGEENCDWL